MKNLARFAVYLARAALSKRRFVRLTPLEAGRIRFYDRRRRAVFAVESRGKTDSFTADQIYTFHDYALDWMRRKDDVAGAYRRIVAAGRRPLIVDCGANIGLSSRYFAEEFPEAQVVALEPEAGNAALARRNCAGLGNVAIREAAIGSAPGFAAIADRDADPNAFRVRLTDRPDGVPVETIGGLEREFADCPLFLVKIDIEGFEADLFERDTDWIDRCEVLIVELHDWLLPRSASSRSFLGAVAARDRDFLIRGENVFSLRN